MGIVRLKTKEQLEREYKNIRDEINTREKRLCDILGLDFLTASFYFDILPEIERLKKLDLDKTK